MLKEFIKIFSMAAMLLAAAVIGQRYLSLPPAPAWLYIYMLILLTGGSAMLAYAMTKCGKAEAQVVFERRFRSILENIELLSVGLNTQASITFCNDALLNLTGWRREDVIGRNWFEVFVPNKNLVNSRELFQRILSRDYHTARHESEIKTRTLECRLIEWNISEMFDPLGQVIGVTFIGKDITEDRQREEQLFKLSRAVEQSPSTVIITDLDGRIEYVNPKFTQLTGYTLDEVRGKNPRILKSGETNSSEYKVLWQKITAGETWQGVFHNRKKNGELYWEATSICPIRDAQGNTIRFLAVKEDITERKLLEEEVEARNREIARNQALAVTGRMANMIAHDLRNPLSSIKMGLQILGSHESNKWKEDDYELAQIALGQIAYMEEIMEDLLTYSRIDVLKPEWLKPDELLNTVLIQVQKEINEHHVNIRREYQPGLPNLHGDRRKLRQVFTNIIINAMQATEGLTDRKPEITISLAQIMGADIPKIRFELTDNGHGIKPELIEKVYEPFFTTRAKGTGLGLSIVNRIIEQHHGMLTIDSKENQGTHVTIELPTGPVDFISVADDRSHKYKKATADGGLNE